MPNKNTKTYSLTGEDLRQFFPSDTSIQTLEKLSKAISADALSAYELKRKMTEDNNIAKGINALKTIIKFDIENDYTSGKNYDKYLSANINDATDEQFLLLSDIELLVAAKQALSKIIKRGKADAPDAWSSKRKQQNNSPRDKIQLLKFATIRCQSLKLAPSNKRKFAHYLISIYQSPHCNPVLITPVDTDEATNGWLDTAEKEIN